MRFREVAPMLSQKQIAEWPDVSETGVVAMKEFS